MSAVSISITIIIVIIKVFLSPLSLLLLLSLLLEAKQKVEEAKRISNFKWGQGFDRLYEKNKKVLEGGEESEEGWIENGRDSKRCKWTVVKRK